MPEWARTNRIEIYNRWGIKVFGGNDLSRDNSWDGRIIPPGKYSEAPDGVCVYVVTLAT